MKTIKSNKWIRLRGQYPIGGDTPCKIDTCISDIERVFIIPETPDEKKFFELDSDLHITGYALGPISHNPDDLWGWRTEEEITEKDIEQFCTSISKYMVELNKLSTAITSVISNPFESKTHENLEGEISKLYEQTPIPNKKSLPN